MLHAQAGGVEVYGRGDVLACEHDVVDGFDCEGCHDDGLDRKMQ